MNEFILMLSVTACYTFTSLSDKYAVSRAKLKSSEFTFLMCFSLSVFLCISLPFQKIRVTLCPSAVAAVLLVALCKMGEFQMSAVVLEQLSAFELKAWLGLTLFASYFTEVFCGKELEASKLFCLVLTAAGLFLIAKPDGKGPAGYKKIAVPLFLYLASKYGYGIAVRKFSAVISPTLQLLSALILCFIILLPFVNPVQMIQNNPRGVSRVVLARIPNTIGMLMENAVIAISLTAYSLIQPMILAALFFIGFLQKEKKTKTGLAGGLLCVFGIILFQVV